MKINNKTEILKGDCTLLLQNIPSESVDAIITDPPYLYLKNQKLDIPFNEEIFFNEAKRVLKKSGFIVMFGRGTAFYRWNTRLADLGFIFKEEIIWDKVMTTSPLLSLNRIHETISIYCKGRGKINKCRVPYLEMKGHNIDSIKADVKRLMSVFSNEKSFEAVNNYLSKACPAYNDPATAKHFTSHTGIINGCDRAVSVIDSIDRGLRERSIIKTMGTPYTTKHDIPCTKKLLDINRSVKVVRSMNLGCLEKSIINQTRDHYTMQHPTQKPVRLMERLMQLVTQEGDLVIDPFMGSGSTGIAALNLNRRFIGMELDDEYFSIAKSRLENAIKEKQQDLFYQGKGA
ncbi:site-specific DNA-methyltransferase [Treponema sp. OMZ 799]|uniref:DNA-methyltransferase n=1 Tax=Treponema sp. OMZ 799 TaxID=2563668 RepID=UPI0020A5E60A|nr:site-specific DNA-methyltransferase [Treponema sp. OMZ 799]UTC78118.1 site-specific DNA-methyltransferase [Treponema sp. OMZ 799]